MKAQSISCLLVILIITFSTRSPLQAAEPRDLFGEFVKTTFQQSCVKCHGTDGVEKGKLNLLKVENAEALKKNPELIETLIDALEFEVMPPETEPALNPDAREKLLSYLKQTLHQVVSSRKQYTSTPIRRMNRFQYNNAVQDLFELDRVVFTLPERVLRDHGNYFQPASGRMPEVVKAGCRPLGKSQLIEKRLGGVTAFPQDLRAEHGFDNRGDHLSLSPILLESFMRLSRSIVESPDFHARSCGIWKQFFDSPNESLDLESEVRSRLRSFLTRAFRRPVEDELLERYSRHVLSNIETGGTFTESMKSAASAALASPRFFYLYDEAGTSELAEPLNDYELASRLSFFLWGSIPDQTLLDLATAGRLSDPQILSQQVDRMLVDRRLKRFCDSFPAQWLQLDRIVSSTPDREKFPEFYFSKYRSSMHLMLEPLLLFETVLIEDRSVLDLIDPEFTYRSDRIEKLWYGSDVNGNLGPVTVLPFKRVPITDRRQGGVITNAAVMTMLSGPERTKPITRGAWLATVIFDNPPEPPPADVPPLKEAATGDEANLTLRERLSLHRERADCAGCHEKIDPLGFALENYDAIGKWRNVYENGREVDMQGTLFRNHEFRNVIEFKDAILTEKDRFTRALASHLLSFGLARKLGVADSPALDRIAEETALSDYRIRRMIKSVVLSEPFRTKTNPRENLPVEVSQESQR